jgi:uncharacterized membrane protein (UPF0182 family)
MEETLADALAVLFKPPSGAPSSAGSSETAAGPGPAGEALSRYDRAMERLKAGDWGGFGAELEAMRAILEQANPRPNVH